jgi:hypothetical protein
LESDNPVAVVNDWMNYFGIPLICDKNFNVYASDDMSQMLAPIALYNFFGSRSSNKCDILPFCEAQHMKNLNHLICMNNPWNQVKNKELCPFGVYWHMYSLEGKSVVRKFEK